jgi:hypothetical protein
MIKATIIIFEDFIGQSGDFDKMAMKLHWSKSKSSS